MLLCFRLFCQGVVLNAVVVGVQTALMSHAARYFSFLKHADQTSNASNLSIMKQNCFKCVSGFGVVSLNAISALALWDYAMH